MGIQGKEYPAVEVDSLDVQLSGQLAALPLSDLLSTAADVLDDTIRNWAADPLTTLSATELSDERIDSLVERVLISHADDLARQRAKLREQQLKLRELLNARLRRQNVIARARHLRLTDDERKNYIAPQRLKIKG